MVYYASLLPSFAAVALGAFLAPEDPNDFRRIAVRFLQGLVILFAVEYLVTAMNDSYYAGLYWPSTPWKHSLGPDWPLDLLSSAASQLKLTGVLFILAFLAALAWRGSKAT
jgi:hypothetical protein